MSDWIKLLLTIGGVALATYITITSTIQKHTYQIERLEKVFDEHMDQHQIEYKEIQSLLTELKVSVAKLGGK